MSTNNSGVPPKPGRRVVLRKIAPTENRTAPAEERRASSSFDRAAEWIGEAPSAPGALFPDADARARPHGNMRSDGSSSEGLAPLPSLRSTRPRPSLVFAEPPPSAPSSAPISPTPSLGASGQLAYGEAIPPAVSTTVLAPHAHALDSSPAGTPLPSRARLSEAPVVASVAADDPAPPAPRAAMMSSTRKACLIGGAVGLSFVAIFVIGARLTYRPTARANDTTPAHASALVQRVETPHATAMATATVVTEAVTIAAAAPSPAQPPASPATPPPREPSRRAAARPSSALGAGSMAKAQKQETSKQEASRPAPDQGEEPTAATTATAAPGEPEPTAAGGNGQGETATSANPLVPVIPSSPPPEVDPLVKAVLEDNESHR